MMIAGVESSGSLLVVEDSDDDFETLTAALTAARFDGRVSRVQSGEECMDVLQRSRSALPAMVLLDLNLPAMDGREVLRRVKSDRELRSIPVVIYTTSTNPNDVAFCYAHHANAYHPKVMDLEALDLQVRTLIAYWSEQVVLPRPFRSGPTR